MRLELGFVNFYFFNININNIIIIILILLQHSVENDTCFYFCLQRECDDRIACTARFINFSLYFCAFCVPWWVLVKQDINNSFL